jgi:hypothetical protein
MRIRPGVLLAVVAALAFLFAGRYLGWFGKSRAPVETTASPAKPPTNAPTPPPISVTVSPAPPTPAPPPASSPRPMRTAPPVTAVATSSPAPAPATAGLITDWEQRIDTILTTEGTESAKSRELLEMLPRLPEDGQVEAAQHLSNLLADEDFKLLTPTFTNAAVPEAVLDVLMTDVLNRPNQLKLPALLEIAQIPNHPKAEEARDVLEVFVDENYGQNWGAWRTAVDKWLKENPDE